MLTLPDNDEKVAVLPGTLCSSRSRARRRSASLTRTAAAQRLRRTQWTQEKIENGNGFRSVGIITPQAYRERESTVLPDRGHAGLPSGNAEKTADA